MGNIHTVGPNEALIVSGLFVLLYLNWEADKENLCELIFLLASPPTVIFGWKLLHID